MILKFFAGIVFLLGLIYLIWPGPSSINDFSPLPESLKSDEPGDTVQVPDYAAYFSQFTRDGATQFYRDEFSYLNIFGVKIPPIAFNYPVEEAKARVREQIQTTYVEEYTYPLRDSLYINGYDKVVWNDLNHIPTDELNDKLIIGDKSFNSKTTIRYYSSSLPFRILVYLGIWVCIIALYRISIRAFSKN